MDLGQGPIGQEGMWKFSFQGGKMVAELMFDGADLDAGVVVKFDAAKVFGAIIDNAEKAIPGDQTALAALLKAYLEGMLK